MAGDKNDLIDVVIPVAGRRGIVKPDHTDHNLDKSAQKHQEELQVQSPPFPMQACGNFGFKHQENSVSFHKDARDTKDKTDPEGGLP